MAEEQLDEDLPAAARPETGERILEAWRHGTLVLPLRDATSPVRLPGLHKSVLPASLSGAARLSLLGVGEHFAAWRVAPQENAPLLVRVPHVDPAELPQTLAHEIAALTLAPVEVGPEPIAYADDPAASPLGVPYVVTSEVPGTAAAPAAWTTAHLAAHAELLARLHTVAAPGRGPVSFGAAPWDAVPTSTPSLIAEVAGTVADWREHAAAVIAEHELEPFLEATLARVAGVEEQIGSLDAFALTHGDLCATNIMWDETPGSEVPRVQYIDFEWAQADDPARDLAIIGGSVHAGPWYVPMDEEAVAGFVHVYLEARRRLGPVPDAIADLPSLRERMRAWTAYERTGMLVHLARRARGKRSYRPLVEQMRPLLAAELGLTV